MDCDIKFTERDKDEQRKKVYNSQHYSHHVVLCNQSGKRIDFNPEGIIELMIDDDISRWWTQGHLIVHDSGFVLQRGPKIAKDLPQFDVNEYKFRGDGYDRLVIDIMPLLDEGEEEGINLFKLPADYWNMWLMRYDMVVYDVEDLPATKHDSKLVKMYFWDEAYQKMLDSNIEWSTAASTADKPAYKMTNNERSKTTGEAVKSLLTDAGFKPMVPIYPLKEPKEDVVEDPYNKKVIAKIDPGTALVYYTSPTQARVIDDLNYLLDRHVGTKNDLCIFRQERSILEEGFPKHFSLMSFSDICDLVKADDKYNPGPWQVEHFFIREKGDGDPGMDYDGFKSPVSADIKPDRDYKLTGLNQITNYRYDDWAGLDNSQAVVARPQFTYSSARKQISYDIMPHVPALAKKHMEDNYLAKLFHDDGKVMMPLNKLKNDAVSISPEWSMANSSAGRFAQGLNKVIAAGIFLNAVISFTALGVTCRQPGRFISIDKMHNNTETDYDNRVLGQWFTTKVIHKFAANTYTTSITAVKIHNFKELTEIDEDAVR